MKANRKLINVLSILFILCGLILFSCSNKNKAKKAIKEDLKLIMHDFKSYEPVQFGKLEVAMSRWEDSPEVAVCLAKVRNLASFID